MSQRPLFEGANPKPLMRGCLCPGCYESVPASWASGMCGPCANEQCEHEDADGESW